MRATITVEGHEVVVDLSGTTARYQTEALKDGYHDLDKITDALRRYNLTLRKSFPNPTAYYLAGWGTQEVREVQVTSITEDGKEAWVRTQNEKGKAKREKVKVENLYARRQSLDYIVQRQEEHKDEIADAWNRAYESRWQPEQPGSENAK